MAEQHNHRIQEFTPSGDFVRAWGSEGSGDGQFYYPSGVASDGSGQLFIADQYNHRIVRVTPR